MMDTHEELEIATLEAVTNGDSLSAPPTPVPESQTLPKFRTTVLPSNGQIVVEEIDELVATALTIMKEDLANEPAWSGAPTPTDHFLLMFLRAEVFSPTMAANRYRKFWETKISLFGEENAALPVTAEAAMEGLKTEVIQIVLGSRDLEGRQVVLINTANSDLNVSRENRIKAVWYVLLTALEEVETQRRGFCFIVTFKGAKLTQVDHKFNKACLASVQGALPARVGSHQMCHPPPFFRVFWAVLSTFMNRRDIYGHREYVFSRHPQSEEGQEENPVLRGVEQKGGPKARSNYCCRKCSVADWFQGYALR